jgi:type I restriction enzyme S subunit
MEKQLIPELRFSEFDAEWKGVELKKIATINPKNDELPNSFVYIDLESVNKGLLSKEERVFKSDAPSRAQRLLKNEDILYQTVRPYQKNNYFFDRTENDYVASTGYAQIRTKNSSKYLYQYLHTNYFVNKVLVRCTGTSYPAINSTDLSKIKVSIPQLPEQQKIAAFLTDVDDKITKLTKKKTLLEKYKKGIMQKIFNQELRFKDDEGKEFPEWEEKKLGEIAVINKGKQLNAEFLTKEGTYPCISGGINPSGFTEDYNKEKNTITISEGGNSCGFVNFFKTKFWCGGHCYAIENINAYINNDFLFQLLKYNETKIMRLRVGSGLPNIQKKDINIFKIKLPISISEQTKIANFLSDIDLKIEALDSKIVNSKSFKKGLLQQMFV